MTPEWLVPGVALVEPPLRNMASERSPAALDAVVRQFCLETAERYRARDVTGDGKDDTFCNWFVHDCAFALGCLLPMRDDGWPYLANELVPWLAGQPSGPWSEVGFELARILGAHGCPVVAGRVNPSGPGHVAMVVPPLGSGLWIAQAGRSNFSCGELSRGFGNVTHQVRFFAHH